MHPSPEHANRRGVAPAPAKRPSAFARIRRTLARVVVPVDGSRASLAGIEYLIRHAPAEHTEIHLLNVQPPVMAGDVSPLVTTRMILGMRRAAGDDALRAARQRLDREGIAHTGRVLFGPVAATILRYAAEQRCTHIVIGTERKGRLARFIHGSVSRELIGQSDVPVTLLSANEVQRSAPRRRYDVRRRLQPAMHESRTFAMEPGNAGASFTMKPVPLESRSR